jgi:hypothetical protein
MRSPVRRLVVLLLLCCAVASCQLFSGSGAAPSNPFAACKSPGQCYLATAGTFNASQQAALQLIGDPQTPAAVREALRQADAKAEPVYEQLSSAYRAYRHAKTDLAAGLTTNDKLVIATADLNRWLTEAGPLVFTLSGLAGQ